MKVFCRRFSGIVSTVLFVAALAHGAASPDPTREPDSQAIFIDSHAIRQAAVFKQEPEYPAAARQFRLSGDVVADFTVGLDGKVETVTTNKSCPLLTESVTRALKKWTFTPFVVDGHPRRVKSTLTFNFHL
jgi:TonB family protein